MKLPTAAYGALEIALNQYITQDEQALAQCRQLAGQSLQVDLTDIGVTLVFVAVTHGLQIMPQAEGGADVRLEGTSRAFARIFRVGAEEGLTGGALRIEGDVGVARRFTQLFASVDFDIGDWLDARLGPVPARFIESGLRNTAGLARRAADTFVTDTAEYLREESRDIIGAREHAAFADAVNRLRADTDRLAARINHLATRNRNRG